MRKYALRLLLLGCYLSNSTAHAQYFSKLYYENRPAMLFGSINMFNNEMYVTGVTNTVRSPYYEKALFGKVNSAGNIVFLNSIADSDSIQYDIFYNTLKKTTDGNFIATGDEIDSVQRAMFLKLDTNGNILLWREYTDSSSMIFEGMDAIEIPDSGYLLVINISINGVSHARILRTDLLGNVLNQHDYFSGQVGVPWIIRPMYNGHYMVGASSYNNNLLTTYWAKTWLIEVNSMGNMVRDWLDTDPTNLWPNGMEQTSDSGWIITRQHLDYDVNNFQQFDGSVLKIDKNFNKQWDIHLGDSSDATGFYDIKVLPDGNYVACGTTPTWGYDSAYYWGWLNKIDTGGNVLWDRKYTAYARFGTQSLLNSLQLLPNGDLVACGQLQFTVNLGESVGQQGWIIKTDSNGCLIDNCWLTDVKDFGSNQLTADVFPNPSRNNFSVKLSWSPPADVFLSVYDITGRLTLHQPLIGQTTTIQNQLNSGIYIWQIGNDAAVFSVGKLVID